MELFSNDNGELIEKRCQDIIRITYDLEKLKLELPIETRKIAGDMLECFGDVKFTKVVTKEIIKK